MGENRYLEIEDKGKWSMAEKIFGKNAVLEGIRSGQTIHKVWMAQGMDKQFTGKLMSLCKEHKIPFSVVDRSVLDKMTKEHHQGVAAEVAPFAYVEIEDILALAKAKGEAPLVLVLSEVEDPHNLGALIRTAECVGVHGIIIPQRRAVGVNETVVKVSAGAAAFMPIARVGNLVQAVEQLKAAGLWIAGAEAERPGSTSIWQSDFTGPTGIVLGSEGKGIAPLLLKNCDYLVHIPMKGQVNSLNVSNAGAVFMYEALRQRQSGK